MAIVDRPPQVDPGIGALLAQVRERILRYIWTEGIAASVATLAASVWLAMGVDWFFEPSPTVRRLLLAAGLLATGVVFYRLVLRRISVPLLDRNLALLLERRFRYFDDSLLTTIDLSGPEADLGELGREMLTHTGHLAAQHAQGIRLEELFRRAPLARAVAAAVVLVLSLGLFAVARPQTLRFGIDRLTGATDELWPRDTRLIVPGFENGQRVVARGDDLEMLVRADMSMPLVPEIVQIRYRTEEGIRGRETMTRSGNAVAGQDEYQDFRHTFSSVLSSLSLDVSGGDARLRGLQVRVVESPTVSEVALFCEYPPYMNRSPREVPVTGSMQVPLGTKITVRARANKDLVRAQIDYPLDDNTQHTESISLPGADGDLRRFQFTLPGFGGDKTLAFTLFDTDGIHNRKPFLVALSAVADEPPQLSLQLRGIGTAITPLARLPLVGKIIDDYGISAAQFHLTIDDQEARQFDFAGAPADRTEVAVDEAFEVRELQLKSGQKLLFGAQASDSYHLVEGDRPHSALSERFQLDVVSPEALRAMLESRELNLRQRFETIIAEVSETRESLTQSEPNGAAPAADESSSAPTASGPQGASAPSQAHVRVERARQNSEKNAQETLGVAGSFDEIREELINNRVDTEELRIRLKDQIADPLRVVGEQMFPELDARLKKLQERLAKPDESAEARRLALQQTDAILVEMQRVRDKMLELESFNEAIEMLRSIIDSEKALQEQVRERQKRKVRDLLEDSP